MFKIIQESRLSRNQDYQEINIIQKLRLSNVPASNPACPVAAVADRRTGGGGRECRDGREGQCRGNRFRTCCRIRYSCRAPVCSELSPVISSNVIIIILQILFFK